jgi:hypothetical protein
MARRADRHHGNDLGACIMPAATAALAAGACAIALACSPAASSDPGDDADLRIPGAQFVPGAMPDGSSDGPAAGSIVLVNSYVHAGQVDFPIAGALGSGATAAAIGLRGDQGYWIVGAGVPPVAQPDSPSYAASATISSRAAPGGFTLVVEGVDANGRFGPPAETLLTVQGPAGAPAGALVFTLTWDTESDLDLHVVDAAGVEIDHDRMSDRPPPFAPQPDAGSYGFLDGDSNANCVIDGKREEDVAWPSEPPSGHYVVRVDAASLCGEAAARWTVTAILDGQTVARAAGTALDAATRGSHCDGAGLTALEIDVP